LKRPVKTLQKNCNQWWIYAGVFKGTINRQCFLLLYLSARIKAKRNCLYKKFQVISIVQNKAGSISWRHERRLREYYFQLKQSSINITIVQIIKLHRSDLSVEENIKIHNQLKAPKKRYVSNTTTAKSINQLKAL